MQADPFPPYGDRARGTQVQDLRVKHLSLVLEAAHELGLSPAAVSLVQRLFERARSQGRGRDGTQALFEMVEQTESAASRTPPAR